MRDGNRQRQVSGGTGAAAVASGRRVVSLRLILSVTTMLLMAAAVLGVASLAERNARKSLAAELETRLLLEARGLATVSAEALLRDYPELTLCPVVTEMLAGRQELALAVVLDHAGVVQGHVEARQLGEPFDRTGLERVPKQRALRPGESLLRGGGLTIAEVQAVHGEGQIVGSALVGLRDEYLERMVTRPRRQLALVTGGLLAAGVLLTLLLVTWLLRPVDVLRAGLERIGRGDLETPMRIRDVTEMGLLAETVDLMAANLLAARRESLQKEAEIIRTQQETVQTLGAVVAVRSQETANHTLRVGEYSRLLALKAGLPEQEAEDLLLAAPMHDIGKIGIPDRILNKPGRLTADEYELMRNHAAIGHGILRQSGRRILKTAAIVALQHHERWDGRGYPQGLKGEQIHIYGRIVALADVFDALSSDRVYRKALDVAEVLAILRQERGAHFDPRLLDLFLLHIDEFLIILDRNPDREQEHDPIPAAAPLPVAEPEAVLS